MGRRNCSRVFLIGLALGGVLCASAGAQQVSTQQAGNQSALRGGLVGQRAVLPNVLGGNRSLPIDRRITLPGLSAPAVYQPATARIPAVVGRHYEGYRDGIRVDGRYDGDKFTLNFHLGQGSNLIDPHRTLYPAGHADGGYFVRNGRVYYNPSWYYYNSGAYLSTRPVDGVLTQRVDYTLRSPQTAQPQQPAPEPERELTAIERATLFMAADDLDRAIEAFRDHLDEDPEDVGAMRSLGTAMVEAGRTEDGIAVIAMAYRTDPMLARTALDLNSLGLDSRRFDTLLSRVLQFAERTDSGSGHLAGVMLLQADRKLTGATRVLDRAEKADLAGEIVDAFRRELGVPARR
jgi:hypothetical protein